MLHVPTEVRFAAKTQRSLPLVRSVRGGCCRGKVILTVRQREPIAETAVRTQPDLAIANLHRRVRFGGAIDDQLRVDVEPKLLLAFSRAEWTADAAHANARGQLE